MSADILRATTTYVKSGIATGSTQSTEGVVPSFDGDSEILRKNTLYFQEVLDKDGVTYAKLGYFAMSSAQPSGNNVNSSDIRNSEIDFVVDAYDLIAPDKSAFAYPRVGPAAFSFQIERTGGPATPAPIKNAFQSFNVTDGYLDTKGVGDFANLKYTRAYYENDVKSNSAMPGPFFYTVTNSGNIDTSGKAVRSPAGNRPGSFWQSKGVQGSPFSSEKTTNDNAKATYPDGFYDITVTATDLHGNSGDKTAKVVLNNFFQTIKTDHAFYNFGDVVRIEGGEQFLGFQTDIPLYLLPNGLPADGGAL